MNRPGGQARRPGPHWLGPRRWLSTVRGRRSARGSERMRRPQPLLKQRLPSGRGAMEQPNITSGGAGVLTPRFWVLVVLAGIAAGLLGVGCSACGTVVLSALLGAGTTATVIGALPLGGLELPIAAVLLLTAALLATARQAQRSGACQVQPARTREGGRAGSATPGRQP